MQRNCAHRLRPPALRPLRLGRRSVSLRALSRAPGEARRRGGRAVEGARLESVFTGNRNVGSNPTPSANCLIFCIINSNLGFYGVPNPLINPQTLPLLARSRHEGRYSRGPLLGINRPSRPWTRTLHHAPICSPRRSASIACLSGEDDRLGTTIDAKFTDDRGDVVARGARANSELPPYRLVVEALRDEWARLRDHREGRRRRLRALSRDLSLP
jgi:hypothetical protein